MNKKYYYKDSFVKLKMAPIKNKDS